MARVIAIDYGLKRTGLAVTDPGQRIATPLDVIETRQLFNFLERYFKEENVEVIVLGEPRRLDGRDTDISEAVRKVYHRLKERFRDHEVLLIDERFTSSMAMDAMIAGGLKKKDRRNTGMVDKISATLILQSYLESRGHSG